MSGAGRATPRIVRGFDRLAPVYDLCADLALAGQIHASQVALLPSLPVGKRALVPGGGSGRFLEALLAAGTVETAVAIDASPAMTRRTLARLNGRGLSSRVDLRTGGLECLGETERFDLVATHCFLDLFEEPEFSSVMALLHRALLPGGRWLFSDFSAHGSGPGGFGRRAFVGALYGFFRAVCGIGARRLPDFEGAFRRLGLETVTGSRYAGGLLRAALYRRPAAG